MRCPILIALFLLLLFVPACREEAEPATGIERLKITVSKNGLYRLDVAELRSAGFPAAAIGKGSVRLSEAGDDVPFVVHGDALVFYGRASTSRYTPVRTYILEAGQQGQRMNSRAAGNAEAATTDAVRSTLHLEQNVEYVSDAAVEGDSAPWFWQTIGLREAEPIAFDLHAVADGSGTIRAGLVGITEHTSEPDHSIGLVVNDNELAQLSWDGQSAYTATVSLPADTLREGENRIQFTTTPKDFLDISKLDWIDIEYTSRPVARDDRLEFFSDRGSIGLQGFSERPLILDVSDATAPVQLTEWAYQRGVAQVALERETTIAAAAAGGFWQPVALEPLRQGGWDEEQHQADLLIIATDELAPALEPLVEARIEEGLSVALVPVEDIYDTFGDGAATPDSINRFLTFAYEEWQTPAPRYVLLVGDATTDYWGHLSAGGDDPVSPPRNVIPPYLVPVSFGGETISDARLADVDGDFLPELAVGRWPVDSAAEVEDLVRRTLAYEKQSPMERALFVADGSSDEFERMTDSIIAAGDFSADRSEFVRGPAPDELASVWQEGAWLVTYTGHGSLQLWSQGGMLSSETVEFVRNNSFSPIVLQLTCLTGLFAHPEITSLSEVMLTAEDGPALVIGATSLTLSLHQEPFAAALLQALQDPSVERIGDALQIARDPLDIDLTGLREISDTFVLLGDPSARIVRPPDPDA